ncbi:type VI lipase adapter Tla3 domain-containing protein [Herbaspirillum robiniae]|uniref:type VI lipase adapter Tla3 domain-containing protein n=1 Tax=Herbaspirillum robiniae TaxID=2014887 RepID=UPI003D786754
MTPRLWPYVVGLLLAGLSWLGWIWYQHYHYYVTTGQELGMMGKQWWAGMLALGVIGLAVFGGHTALLNRAAVTSADAGAAEGLQAGAASPAIKWSNPSPLMRQDGRDYVLEVRAIGTVVDKLTNDEIWKKIEKKSETHLTILSTDPSDYPDDDYVREHGYTLSIRVSFRYGARGIIDQWPMPAIAYGPPKHYSSGNRAGKSISSGRSAAGLGVALFLWEDDANTEDGAESLEKLFSFFDRNPDVPAAMVISRDGTYDRLLRQAPGSGRIQLGAGKVEMPDSMGALMVTRSDRVDQLVRPFAVHIPRGVNKTNTEYDLIKQWNFYWKKSEDRGPDSFEVQYEREEKARGVLFPMFSGIVSSTYWHSQLPELWQTISNKGPGQFNPSPYLPIRWTDWQVRQFDAMPLLGYLHRPVDVNLNDEHGKPLRTPYQVQALKEGWARAVEGLEGQRQPRRVFYDTSTDKHWVIPLTQALAQSGDDAPRPSELKEGYDIGYRIGKTGVSSPLIQVGLAIVAGYEDGAASATVNLRPGGRASIVMVSPPEPERKKSMMQAFGAP